MAPTSPGSPAGIVFRRLAAEDERRRAALLLPRCSLGDHDARCAWFGLCDLTETDATGLAGVVVVRSVGPRTARLCGLAVPARHAGAGLGQRLLHEVADRARAAGVDEVIAPPPPDRTVAALLAEAGFAAGEQVEGCSPGWSRLRP